MIVRELTGGIYFGQPKGRERVDGHERAFDTLVSHDARDRADRAGRVRDGAQAPEEGLFHRQGERPDDDGSLAGGRDARWGRSIPTWSFRTCTLTTRRCSSVRNPRQFDVVLADNMFGDILSDEAAQLTGSLGMLPSASLAEGTFGLYEPSGGSAPDIAGKGIANPIAQILSAGMMLKYSFGMSGAAERLDRAVAEVLDAGFRTRDIALGDPGRRSSGRPRWAIGSSRRLRRAEEEF